MLSIAFHPSFTLTNGWTHSNSFSSQLCCSTTKPRLPSAAICFSRLPPTALAKRSTNTNELEESLLASVHELEDGTNGKGVHQYRKSQPEKFSAAAEVVSQLELSMPGFGVSAGRLKTLLPGKWTLVLTDSVAVEKNAGSITGLGSLPGARCKRVDVVLDSDGKARTVEAIKVFGGLMDGENALIGKWRLSGKSGRTLEVTYASALLMGKATVRADSKAVLETTYCSNRLRIGRSKGGEFYLFLRA